MNSTKRALTALVLLGTALTVSGTAHADDDLAGENSPVHVGNRMVGDELVEVRKLVVDNLRLTIGTDEPAVSGT